MEVALNNTRQYLLKKQQEQQEAMKLFENHKELNFRQAELLKDMIKHKGDLVSIREVMSKFNVVNQTARTDLLFLTELGFLEKKMIGNKMFFTYRGEATPQGSEE
jgi:Fic family protein